MFKVIVETALGDHAQIWIDAVGIDVLEGDAPVLTFTDDTGTMIAAFNDWRYAYHIDDPALIPANPLALNEGRTAVADDVPPGPRAGMTKS